MLKCRYHTWWLTLDPLFVTGEFPRRRHAAQLFKTVRWAQRKTWQKLNKRMDIEPWTIRRYIRLQRDNILHISIYLYIYMWPTIVIWVYLKVGVEPSSGVSWVCIYIYNYTHTRVSLSKYIKSTIGGATNLIDLGVSENRDPPKLIKSK